MPDSSFINIPEEITVRRGRVQSVDLFDVKKEELDLIEVGLINTPATQSFASFSASIAMACGIATVSTEQYKWPMMESVFPGVAVACSILAAYLFRPWLVNRSSQKELIREIRRRMKNGNGH